MGRPIMMMAIVTKNAMEMSTACGGITSFALKPGGRPTTVVWDPSGPRMVIVRPGAGVGVGGACGALVVALV
jgi:hypothetical protein